PRRLDRLRHGAAQAAGELGRRYRSRTAGRLRYAARRRLHLRSRYLRNSAAVPTLHRRHHRLHGDSGHDGRGHPSRVGRLSMWIIAPLVCGLIFGAGLLISGMVQPTKVLGFLDIFGAWDPSLAVVMAAALAVVVPGFRLANR